MWIESKKGKRRTSTPSRKVKFVTDSIEPWGWFINRSVWPRGSERDSGPNEAYNGCSSTVNHQINEPTIDQSNRSVHQTDEPDWTCRNIYKFIRLIFFPGTASCSADHDDPPPPHSLDSSLWHIGWFTFRSRWRWMAMFYFDYLIFILNVI